MPLFKFVIIAIFCFSALPAAANKAVPRIIGGTAVIAPTWMVAVGENIDGGWLNYCGGTLLDKEWVVTAAHCVDDLEFGNREVTIGVSDLSKHHIRTAVDQVLIHTEFLINRLSSLGEKMPTLEKDIALLHLATPVTLAPIKMAAIGIKDTWATGTTQLRTYGYGAINPQATLKSPVLQAIEIPYQGSRDNWYNTPVLSHIFAGQIVGKDSCKGDSGSPLVYNGELVGITSFGLLPCTSVSPVAYTYAPALFDWINEQKRSVSLTSLRSLSVPAKQSRWAEFLLVNRTDVPTTLSDLNTTAPEITHDCQAELKPGQACTIRVRFEGRYAINTIRDERIRITSTQSGHSTVLQSALLGTTIKEEQIVTSAPQPAAAASGGGGAFDLKGLLLLPLIWLRRRH